LWFSGAPVKKKATYEFTTQQKKLWVWLMGVVFVFQDDFKKLVAMMSLRILTFLEL